MQLQSAQKWLIRFMFLPLRCFSDRMKSILSRRFDLSGKERLENCTLTSIPVILIVQFLIVIPIVVMRMWWNSSSTHALEVEEMAPVMVRSIRRTEKNCHPIMMGPFIDMILIPLKNYGNELPLARKLYILLLCHHHCRRRRRHQLQLQHQHRPKPPRKYYQNATTKTIKTKKPLPNEVIHSHPPQKPNLQIHSQSHLLIQSQSCPCPWRGIGGGGMDEYIPISWLWRLIHCKL